MVVLPRQRTAVQVVVTVGPGDQARAALGFEAALAAAAGGIDTAVFLTLDATEWACEPRLIQGGERVYALLDQLQAFGATVTCCSACAMDRCGSAPSLPGGGAGGAGRAATAPGVELIGLTSLMERVAAGVPTVTF